MNKWIFLIFLLSIIPMAYAQSCYDSDGLDFYTKGTITFDSKTYTDNCVNDEVLIEGYCGGNYFKVTTNYCPEGCNNGVCKKTVTPEKTSKMPESVEKELQKLSPAVRKKLDTELNDIKKTIEEGEALWQADYNSIFLKSDEERKMLCGLKTPPPIRGNEEYVETRTETIEYLPDFFDWRDQHGRNYVTDIRDQGNCGSCWAFATLAALEGGANTYYNNPDLDLNLSEQDLVSCYAGNGCNGIHNYEFPPMLEHIRDNGIANESCFPYSGTNDDCNNKCADWMDDVWKITSYRSVPLPKNSIKYAIITEGPVVAGMVVYDDFFSYSEGIYHNTTDSISGYHAVTIVGWDAYDGINYWIVKNSWGEGWGENGYFRILFDNSDIDSLFIYSLDTPIIPTSQETICNDNDLDGYCNWGLGPKPDNCPVCDLDIEDCDDSDNSIYIGCGSSTVPSGLLYVSSTPSRAKVYVADIDTGDYLYHGETPLVGNLSVGSRQVKLSKKDYFDNITTVLIEEDQTTSLYVELFLTPKLSYPSNYDIFRTGDIIRINGTVFGPNFQNYIVEYGLGSDPVEWFTNGITLVNGGLDPFIEDTLAYWDTSSITEANRYTIRLTVNCVDQTKYEYNISNIYLDPTLQEGWPQTTGSDVDSSPTLIDLDGDGNKEVIVGSVDRYLYVWYHNGTPANGWPQYAHGYIDSSPSVADIDNDGDLEIIVGIWGDTWEPGVYVWNHDGSLVDGWPQTTGDHIVWSSPVLADIDNDEYLEIIICSYDGKIYVWNHDGSLVDGWPQTIAIERLEIWSTPAVADLDNDDDLEIVVSANRDRIVYVFHHDGTIMSGWPFVFDDRIDTVGSPTVGDLDNDDDLEIVVNVGFDLYPPNGSTYALHHDGTIMSGWPVNTGIYSKTSSALSDLDNDGDLEIVTGGNLMIDYNRPDRHVEYRVYALHHDGTIMSGWPVLVYGVVESSPAIADIDNDGDIEIVIGSYGLRNDGICCDGRVYALHHDGTIMTGWPKSTKGTIWVSSPALGDIDGDGDVEIAIGSWDNKLYVWDQPGQHNPNMEWPMFRHDERHTGLYEKFCPDTNDDRKVDFNDVVTVAMAYGSHIGDAHYDPEADFDNDGDVDFNDVVTVAMYYGESC